MDKIAVSCFTVGICLWLMVISVADATSDPDPRIRLMNSIFSGTYYKDFIPQGTVSVKFGISLVRAMLDTDKHMLDARLWTKYEWREHRLTWDPASYGNISEIRISPEWLWRPDIVLYNKVKSELELTNVVLYSDGRVLWVPPLAVTVDCTRSDDVYICPMTFGSWTFPGNMLDLDFYEDKAEVDLGNYKARFDIDVVETSADRIESTYSCCPEVYPSINYRIIVRPTSEATSGTRGHVYHWPIFVLILFLCQCLI